MRRACGLDGLATAFYSVFLLEWISNQLLRQTVTAMTNKVESYHGFSKWLSFGGEVIAENDPDEQQKQIRYNDLLASAVILQNVIDMSKIIADLRREGWTTTKSPYLTGVKRFSGYYAGEDRETIGPEDLSRTVAQRIELLKASVSKHAVLVTELGQELPTLQADAAQIRRIVLNLVTNASQAIGDRDGIILVRAVRVAAVQA